MRGKEQVKDAEDEFGIAWIGKARILLANIAVQWTTGLFSLVHQLIPQKEYRFYCDVLRSGHCQREYVRAKGEEFWEGQLEKAINAGSRVGKGFHEVRQEISYAMVSIYESLGSYSKAYDFLVEQATSCPWLHLFTV